MAVSPLPLPYGLIADLELSGSNQRLLTELLSSIADTGADAPAVAAYQSAAVVAAIIDAEL